jgi:hypothetical protein
MSGAPLKVRGGVGIGNTTLSLPDGRLSVFMDHLKGAQIAIVHDLVAPLLGFDAG